MPAVRDEMAGSVYPRVCWSWVGHVINTCCRECKVSWSLLWLPSRNVSHAKPVAAVSDSRRELVTSSDEIPDSSSQTNLEQES